MEIKSIAIFYAFALVFGYTEVPNTGVWVVGGLLGVVVRDLLYGSSPLVHSMLTVLVEDSCLMYLKEEEQYKG